MLVLAATNRSSLWQNVHQTEAHGCPGLTSLPSLACAISALQEDRVFQQSLI